MAEEKNVECANSSIGAAVGGRFLTFDQRSGLSSESAAEQFIARLRVVQVIPFYAAFFLVVQVVTVDPRTEFVFGCDFDLRFSNILPLSVIRLAEIAEATDHEIHLRLFEVTTQVLNELLERIRVEAASSFSRASRSPCIQQKVTDAGFGCFSSSFPY